METWEKWRFTSTPYSKDETSRHLINFHTVTVTAGLKNMILWYFMKSCDYIVRACFKVSCVAYTVPCKNITSPFKAWQFWGEKLMFHRTLCLCQWSRFQYYLVDLSWVFWSLFQRRLWPAVWSGDPATAGWAGHLPHPRTRWFSPFLSPSVSSHRLQTSPCLFSSPPDELLTAQEKGSKEVVISVTVPQDSDKDSKTTNNQSTPLIIRGPSMTHIYTRAFCNVTVCNADLLWN